jgi:hypothetical protein
MEKAVKLKLECMTQRKMCFKLCRYIGHRQVTTNFLKKFRTNNTGRTALQKIIQRGLDFQRRFYTVATWPKISHVYVYFIILSCENVSLKKCRIFWHLAEFFSKICRQLLMGPGNSEILASLKNMFLSLIKRASFFVRNKCKMA